jgi:molecular chaperone DnaK
LRSATENLERELHKVAEVLYKSQSAGAAQAGAAGAGAGAGSGPAGSAGGSQQQKKPDDVIDAEYVDVDENKRPN